MTHQDPPERDETASFEYLWQQMALLAEELEKYDTRENGDFEDLSPRELSLLRYATGELLRASESMLHHVDVAVHDAKEGGENVPGWASGYSGYGGGLNVSRDLGEPLPESRFTSPESDSDS